MWVKNLVKFMLVLHFVVLSWQSEENAPAAASDADSKLPNIWEDEAVSRMIREVLARDLVKEHEQRHQRRQHKRDVTVSPAVAEGKKAPTTRKAPATTQKAKKPIKVTQTGNKTKNRVTPSTAATKATVKPSMKPIVANTNLGVNSLSKAKVRTRRRHFTLRLQLVRTFHRLHCAHVEVSFDSQLIILASQWIYDFHNLHITSSAVLSCIIHDASADDDREMTSHFSCFPFSCLWCVI
jgi:hypothetical protein